ncbi:MAG: SH3 domain-containing protein [Lachnospiraceae bacterium]|nr:SH3 domain-containing protein [Lachnospiraceae bacterium]
MEKLKKILAVIAVFFQKYGRYVGAGALFVLLAVLVVKFTKPSDAAAGNAGNGNAPAVHELSDETAEAYQVDVDEQINELIRNYYTYYANGDITNLETVATPISDGEKSFIQMYSNYVDSYDNLACYTKSGLSEDAYLVSVYLEIKFNGVETPAPGLDFFYVEKNADGNYCINNLYSQYNSLTKEQPTDPAIDALIQSFETQEDVLALQSDVQMQYETAISSDPNLDTLINTTIADAYATWAKSLNPTETAAAEETTETEQPAEETPEEEQPAAETPTADAPVILVTTNRVNLRDDSSQDGQVLSTLDEGTEVAMVSDVGNGWYAVAYNGTNGYIIGDYLKKKDGQDTAGETQAAAAEETQEQTDTNDTQTTTDGPSGTVTLSQHDVVTIRSSASSDSEKIGTAYTGDKIKVLSNESSGWSKVEFNGKTGYIRTDLLS